ncbi:unsaturated chondroitin disaccharide hydrolase [Paenibacillus phyllosphaerae]|uniref:Unsaturated chondroitin disaccharide hydrolase n=1 Tax=Paenibacillus phyllosphaerae TaxID=274593 RepID=A0A7W5AYM2_9BACL|nr:glycoside hydrolase family 88 protein [Paenibacillus phyllosphaerae]MBB3110987.1 unsaturated chondroitin disaccharide hydrolase [Paenibacillus phyllosphaerae]
MNRIAAQASQRLAAIEDAVAKVRRNLERNGQSFPHITNDKRYDWGANEDWIEGFHTGLAWLCYEYTGDDYFRGQANLQIDDFRRRLTERICLDHHDIGFLYGLSAFAGWVVEGKEDHRELAIQAADLLMERWRGAGYIQAWGPEGDPDNGGRIIIDCLLNLPLLYWAAEATGNDAYKEIALKQAELSRRYLVRGDDSSYHTFYFDTASGEPIRGGTHQGYNDGSTWTRGQAWGIYGFALSYRYTGKAEFLETAKRLADYFIRHLPEDGVAYWDFHAPLGENTSRDSSASAIAACGMLEILTHLPEADHGRQRLEAAVSRTMDALMNGYATVGEEAEGLLDHGSYHVRGGLGLDGYMIWGDYYYLEALLRLERGIPGYWYERR